MNELQFSEWFNELTGHDPLPWQWRLFDKHFTSGDLCSLVDLPTGLGKTMVMAVWLIARKINARLPRRLIYVVDRRTVVDQATDLATKLQKSLGDSCLAVSTLRGQLADNRKWSQDLSRPAIVIGTVDLIGSALLFSAYRSSFRRRPLEAGLLGQDSLLVLDEAHLSKPFEKLVKSIASFQQGQGLPMHVIRMSATSGESNGELVFSLDPVLDLSPGDETSVRYNATKRLRIDRGIDKKKLNEALSARAIELAQDDSLRGKRIVVFVRSPEDAKKIEGLIRDHEVQLDDTTGSKAKRAKSKPYTNSVAVLTGTMRGLERDELVEKNKNDEPADAQNLVMQRFLDGDIDPGDETNQKHVFLVSTSAGEVGLDLNADHMVCDAAPLDSMIQRLGRVNRRGKGDAVVCLVLAKDLPDKSHIEKACVAASDLFYEGMDLSPKALAELRLSLSAEGLKAALSPEPVMVELNDILLDAWSMTSIAEPMPGRPEVAPWLRGVADELPQTTIAWRAELDLPGFDQLDLEEIEEWFDTHRVLTHEALSVPTSAAAKWFTDRWDKLTDAQKSNIGGRSIIVDRAGFKLVTIKELVAQIARKGNDSTAVIRNADLILPASFGGIERGKGLLDAGAPEVPKDEDKKPHDERRKAIESRQAVPDVADERGRYREIIIKTEDGEPDIKPLSPGTKPRKFSRFVIDLESDDDRVVRLVSYVPKQEKPEWGLKRQLLSEHVALVRKRVDDILSRIDVPDAMKQAAQLAADFHDHGKNRERWQRTVDGTATAGTTDWMKQTMLEGDGKHQTLGKSGDDMKRDPRGYRHEFGSLREFIDECHQKIDQDVFDLAMHLIATHHGRGRPHFPKGGFDPDTESPSPTIHVEVIRRFARLQRKYGWWRLAWLENLLRCADVLASVDENAEKDMNESSEEAGYVK